MEKTPARYERSVALIFGNIKEKDVVIKDARQQLRLGSKDVDLEIEGYAKTPNGRVQFKMIIEVPAEET